MNPSERDLKYFIDLGVQIEEVNDEGITPLLLCLEKNFKNISIMQVLLENGANPNSMDPSGNNSLHLLLSKYKEDKSLANYSEKLDACKLLLSFGADVSIINHENEIPIQYLYNKNDEVSMSIMALLIKNGSPVLSEMKEKLFKFAIENGNINIYEEFLLNGEDPNRLEENGLSLLENAILKNNLALVELLLKNGALVNSKYIRPLISKSPIQMAFRVGGCFEIVNLLLANGAEINQIEKKANDILEVVTIRGCPYCKSKHSHKILLPDNNINKERLISSFQCPNCSYDGFLFSIKNDSEIYFRRDSYFYYVKDCPRCQELNSVILQVYTSEDGIQCNGKCRCCNKDIDNAETNTHFVIEKIQFLVK